jgi:hypothetical protein
MKMVLAILGSLALIFAPMSLMAADGDLQTLAPLTDDGNVVNVDTNVKQYYVVSKLVEK